MNVLRTRNVHRALPLALEMLRVSGVKVTSRNGDAWRCPQPVSTVYSQPCERVMFWPQRDANPFFHFFESLWMLGGRNDVESVARYTKQVREYSDDGVKFHGVYGRRWRVQMPADREPPLDQLVKIGDALRQKPDCRRQVLQMWDSASDLGNPSKDVPCNTTATFQIGVDGRLDLVVFNRSNDIIWGCYGANAVQFSMLLEYVACRVGTQPGTYTQVSVNWHGYDATYTPLFKKFQETTGDITDLIDEDCPYSLGQVKPHPLMSASTQPDDWDRSLHRLLMTNGRAPLGGRGWDDPFFPDVAVPILQAHDAYKDGSPASEERFEISLRMLENCRASDWRQACSEWITRRWRKWQRDADDGPVTR